jgi:hypothetical protein
MEKIVKIVAYVALDDRSLIGEIVLYPVFSCFRCVWPRGQIVSAPISQTALDEYS